jgi:hypothetical protein
LILDDVIEGYEFSQKNWVARQKSRAAKVNEFYTNPLQPFWQTMAENRCRHLAPAYTNVPFLQRFTACLNCLSLNKK